MREHTDSRTIAWGYCGPGACPVPGFRGWQPLGCLSLEKGRVVQLATTYALPKVTPSREIASTSGSLVMILAGSAGAAGLESRYTSPDGRVPALRFAPTLEMPVKAGADQPADPVAGSAR